MLGGYKNSALDAGTKASAVDKSLGRFQKISALRRGEVDEVGDAVHR
jgi:hypothetical protein